MFTRLEFGVTSWKEVNRSDDVTHALLTSQFKSGPV